MKDEESYFHASPLFCASSASMLPLDHVQSRTIAGI